MAAIRLYTRNNVTRRYATRKRAIAIARRANQLYGLARNYNRFRVGRFNSVYRVLGTYYPAGVA